MCCRRYGNSTIQALLATKQNLYGDEGRGEGGSSQRITIVPPLNSSVFSDIVIPTVIVSVVVVVSLFAIIVLLLLRRHLALEGQENLGHYDDRNALTPGSVRRLSPPHQGHHSHHQQHRQQQHQQQPLTAASQPQQQQPQQPQHNGGGLVMHIDVDSQREQLFLC